MSFQSNKRSARNVVNESSDLQCGKDCYIKGRGCVYSVDGRCLHVHHPNMNNKEKLKLITDYYVEKDKLKPAHLRVYKKISDNTT